MLDASPAGEPRILCAMQQIVTIIAPSLVAIAFGYVFGRVSKASVTPLVNVSIYVAAPCLVFVALYSNEFVFSGAVRLWAACILILVGTFVVAWVVFGLIWKNHKALYLPIVFQNAVNLPLPIIALAFPENGVALMMIFHIPYALALNSVGVYMAAGKRGFKEGFRAIVSTPLIYAVVLGLVLNVTGADLPEVVVGPLRLVGAAAVPLALLTLGMTIGGIRFTQLSATLVASVIRVGGGFCFGLLAVWLLGLTGVPRAVVLLQAAMPSAVFASVLSTRYKNEEELVSSVVLATTLMAVVVLPALLYYLT